MKDETKDLLQYLKNVYESEETSTWLNKLQIKDLLDYITNLQEETERQSKAQVILDNQIAEMLKYKQRNEKAIEYIKENSYFEGNEIKTMIYQDYSKYILETLQGKSDE